MLRWCATGTKPTVASQSASQWWTAIQYKNNIKMMMLVMAATEAAAPFPSTEPSLYTPAANFLSATLGSNMVSAAPCWEVIGGAGEGPRRPIGGLPSDPPWPTVLHRPQVLQRAPQQAVLWGAAPSGTVVNTTFGEHALTTTADSAGVWRQKLPATPASSTPHTIRVAGAHPAGTFSAAAALSNGLFGDVFLCGGQSNMQFSMPAIANATAEIALANRCASPLAALRLASRGSWL